MTGESDRRFIEGRRREDGGQVTSDASPSRQSGLRLHNLERELERHGDELRDILQLTLYLTEMDADEQVDRTDEQYCDDAFLRCTTVSVCKLLGGSAVPIDAVVAVE